ncbi:DUF2189 domain-containing protein [Oceanicella actignis]|uniref:Uncharacterized membrane protein n=1 Tax=Oceanicella actignis TaxID=1189325 RepID=A0A1M7TXJ5_9RHOB|nr:DUF2189 domain-containing protein [Oceanicella actignis]SET80502.1 Uncharacterized membrane protein [Oceanicella actignis]SHN75469.1 Uncharacterized membrane protein [Oceanicella actignis]
MNAQTPRAYPPMPRVRPLSWADIRDAVARGLDDFRAAPLYGLFFGGIFAAGGLLMLAFLTRLEMPWMILFLGVGFPLIGPFAAVGLYEVSRRRELGLPLSWRAVLGVVFAQSRRELGWMAFVTLFIFWVWIYQVRLLLALFLGGKSFSSLDEFLTVVATTPEGLGFLAVGTLDGAFLATVLFSATVTAIPLLLDRERDFITALIVSFQTVFRSPVVMIGWAWIVTAAVMLSMLPAFLGLVVTLPVLGHATWHLYRRAVEPDEAPTQDAAQDAAGAPPGAGDADALRGPA